MNEDLIKQVEELGLSNKESRVYLANLSLGPAGVQQIADASGIKRVTTYVILESLVNLGLVSQTTQAKKTLFNAEAPENLRRLLEKREESLKDQKLQLEDLLPQLKSVTNLPTEAPHVKFYEGVEGLRTLMRDYIKVHAASHTKFIYGMSNLDVLYAYFPEIEQNQANPDRIEAGIASKFLYTSKKGPVFSGSDMQKNRKSRYLPLEKFPFSTDITVVGDSVVFISLSGQRPIGVTIQSAEIAEGISRLFELAWKAAEDFQ